MLRPMLRQAVPHQRFSRPCWSRPCPRWRCPRTRHLSSLLSKRKQGGRLRRGQRAIAPGIGRHSRQSLACGRQAVIACLTTPLLAVGAVRPCSVSTSPAAEAICLMCCKIRGAEQGGMWDSVVRLGDGRQRRAAGAWDGAAVAKQQCHSLMPPRLLLVESSRRLRAALDAAAAQPAPQDAFLQQHCPTPAPCSCSPRWGRSGTGPQCAGSLLHGAPPPARQLQAPSLGLTWLERAF